MLKLYHHPFSTTSRFVRLMLAEHDAKVDLIVEKSWERRPEFLELNPAGSVPVLVENDGPPIVGSGPIMEYIDETRGYALGDRRPFFVEKAFAFAAQQLLRRFVGHEHAQPAALLDQALVDRKSVV